MALDKFFCKVPETKVTDKQIEFHSEREANEYCRENDIDPHNVILMGDKYIIKTKDSNFRTTREDVRCTMSNALDKAIRMCDEKIRLVKTISKKNGYAIHIVEGGYGERIVLTFPNESYANPHMWLGSNNSSNIQKAKELLDEFSK